MDLWGVNHTIRRPRMRDVPGPSAVRGVRIRRCLLRQTMNSPKVLRQTSLPARHQHGLQIAEGIVTFFKSYERELEKYWTKTLFFQLS